MAVLNDVINAPREALNVRRVFGDPIEKGALTVVPVAMTLGGGGGGAGPGEDGENEGGGFGVLARPVGVYVIENDSVNWQPSLDVTLVALAGMLLAAFMMVTLRALVRRRHFL